MVPEDDSPSDQSCRRRWAAPAPATDRTEASRQEVPNPVSAARRTSGWRRLMIFSRRTRQIVLTIVARLAHGFSPTANLAVKGINEAAKSGFEKRKKTKTYPRLSCKIEYLLTSNHSDGSIASEFFTGDYGTASSTSDAEGLRKGTVQLSALPSAGTARHGVCRRAIAPRTRHRVPSAQGLFQPCYFSRIVTPPTAADNSAPTFGPLSCRITPLAFCN